MIYEDRYIECPVNTRALRLLVITPVHPENGQEGPFPLSRLDRRLLLPTTKVDEMLCAGAPSPIYGAEAIRATARLIVSKAKWADSIGYDAVLVNCMVDPGVREAQRLVGIPIVGAGQAAMALASVLGQRPAIIYPDGIPVNELAHNQQLTLEKLRESATRQIRLRGADVITFACSYLGGASQQLQDYVGVPVVGTIDVALRITELIALLGIRPARFDVEGQRAAVHHRIMIRIIALLRQLPHRVANVLR